jgi:hypothetical protein
VELLTITVVTFFCFVVLGGMLTITVVNFQNKTKFTTVMVNNSTNTTKQNKVYNSDGQQFHQYNKTKESLQQ